MNCQSCGHENRPEAKYCAECGDSLQVVCPVCSFRSPPDAKFCSNCGNSLAGVKPRPGQDVTRYVPPEMLTKMNAARVANPMRGERRTVTMLFADLQGSTAAAETLDPEDWTDIANGAFEHLIEPVYRYEGTLARLLGDAVLAFFGAPIAHEDDPVRAVRAGLEIVEAMGSYKDQIQERWGIPIDVRVGINTGLVVVGEVGSDLRVEYTALGDAVNVAARMEQTADPGTVRVTGDTWELVSSHFAGEELGPVDVKGKSEPVPAFRVTSIRPSSGGSVHDRPLVGRTEEFERLRTLCARLNDREGWVASVMGEAGVGKSRLLEEFRTSAPTLAVTFDAGGELGWMSAFNQSYDASVPYSTMRQMLWRWWAGDGDGYERVQQAVASVEGEPDSAIYLAHLASLPLPSREVEFLEQLETPVLDGRTRKSAVAYIEAESRRRPLVICVEDLHWADPLSLALLEDIMALTEAIPLGLLFTMRPYRDEAAWRIHEAAQRNHAHRYEAVELDSLPSDAARDMLETLLVGADVTEELRERVLERSDGNPLFIDLMAKEIQEGEAGADTVPTGLSSLLTARLDRLDTSSRTVAQIASVIGIEFAEETLSSLVGEEIDFRTSISDLLRREIVVKRRNQTGTLGFHHALMRDAAYATMLLKTRRELHSRLAGYLEAEQPNASQEIAHHLQEAGELDRAFPHLVQAGEKSSRAMALADAIEFFNTALEHIPSEADPDLVARAHDGLGVAYTLVPDLTQSEATYQKMADYADSSGRPSAKVTALNRLAMNAAMMRNDMESAHAYLDQARTLATEAGDEFGLAQYHMNACTIAGLGGDLTASVMHDEETARWGKELGQDELRAEGLTRLAENSVWLMDFNRAVPVVEEAMEVVQKLGDEHNLAILRSLALARLQLRDGNLAGSVQMMVENQDVLDRYASFFAPLARSISGQLVFEIGDVEEAVTLFQKSRSAAEESGAPFFVAVASAGLARIYGAVGLDDAMAAEKARALKAVSTPLGDFMGSSVWTELGYAALWSGDLPEAERLFDRGLESSSASKYWEKPRLLLGRALVAGQGGGDLPLAGTLLDEAQELLEEKEIRTYDAHLSHARGVVSRAEGDLEAAADHLREAWREATDKQWKALAMRVAEAGVGVAAARGDSAEARRYAEAGSQLAEEMIASTSDQQLREAVTSTWLIPLGTAL